MQVHKSSVSAAAVALLVAVLATELTSTYAGPKKYTPPANSPERAAESRTAEQSEASAESRDPAARFGIQTNTISTTGATGLFPGLNPGPIKLDLGGLLLGAVLGLGAVLVLPKLLHVVSPHPHYDGYKRSEDGGSGATAADGSDSVSAAAALSTALARVDAALARHHVDSSACVQRAVCSLVSGASGRVRAGDAGLVDNALDSLASADLVGMMLDGTAVKSAVDVGRRGGDCASSFAGCLASRDALIAALRGLATGGAAAEAADIN